MRAYYDYTYYRPRHKRYSYMTGNDVEYTYGTSGNETGRFLFWTEDCYGCEHRLCQSNEVSNRMHAAVDEKYSSYYVYDHSGERRVKLTGTNDLLDVNADYMYTASVLKEPTIYPSAYMVMSNRGYTNVVEVESRASSLVLPRCSNVTERKHYYAGTERVAARIGGGGLKVIDQEHGLSDKSGSVFKQSLRQINDRILENNDINCIANGLSSNDKLTIDMNEVPERLQAELITDYDEFRHTIADAQSIHHNEPDVYFYHSDHLGSASWITDNGGLAVQHLQYLPYGERYVDQRTAGYHERFTFTGKERDEETGYGYFGARYMDHELMTMWLSVDPMADKYPSISPYAYCAWNPVRLVDPDGGKIKISGNIIYSPNMKSDGCDDFDKTAIDALNHLYSSEEGALMINKLCEYDGDIGIYEDFYTNYQVNGPETSFYNENEGKPGTGIFSEITINWNIENPESVPTLNGMQANATYNLLDEICHAYDLCTGYGTLAKTEEGDYKAEFQAVYRSNVVRHQLNDNNYRSQYYTNSKDSKGAGQKTARRRNNENVFYQPSWYPRCDTDNVSILSQGF